MAKPPGYELTDAEKRDLMQLIEQGKNSPEQDLSDKSFNVFLIEWR